MASPALFNVQCKSPRQMELANAFCRYLEMVPQVTRPLDLRVAKMRVLGNTGSFSKLASTGLPHERHLVDCQYLLCNEE